MHLIQVSYKSMISSLVVALHRLSWPSVIVVFVSVIVIVVVVFVFVVVIVIVSPGSVAKEKYILLMHPSALHLR